jgi:dihydroxy-acid dehydratase
MGTALTMNSLAEALGMSLPGCASAPAPHRDRAEMAYETGKRIVDMVWEDLRPSKIMTREAFENVIAVNSAIGGSTNAPIHLNAIARHIGVELDTNDWEKVGYEIPLLVNLQPAGEYLGEEFHRAGGVPAVVNELLKAGKIRKNALTVNGKTLAENCENRPASDPPLWQAAQGQSRIPQHEGQSVRQCHHEDERDIGSVPATLPVQSQGSECV